MTISRGIRNNNPGNIDYSARNAWRGQLSPDPAIEKRFARFDAPENGIRALAKLLVNYRTKTGMPGVGGPGIDTVRETINRWAPPVENSTESYIAAVSAAAGVLPDEPINIRCPLMLPAVVTAIIRHENGSQPYSPAVIAEGVRRALA